MEMKSIDEVKTADEARDIAMEWQSWLTGLPFPDSLSYSEMADWEAYFRLLVRKFPELRDEFKENGII